MPYAGSKATSRGERRVPQFSGYEPIKNTMFVAQNCGVCDKQTVMVPVLTYLGTALALRPVSADQFGRTHGTPIGRRGKEFLFYCVECHEPVVRGTKEQVKKLQSEFKELAERSNDDQFKCYLTLGNGFQRLLYLDEALFSLEADRLLRMAVKADPEQFMAYNCLSTLYVTTGTKQKHFQTALEFAGMALERASDSVEEETVYSNMGSIHYQLKAYDQAIDCFQKAIQSGDCIAYYYSLGNCFMALDRHEEAKDAFIKYLESDDDENKLYDEEDVKAAVEICERRVGQ